MTDQELNKLADIYCKSSKWYETGDDMICLTNGYTDGWKACMKYIIEKYKDKFTEKDWEI